MSITRPVWPCMKCRKKFIPEVLTDRLCPVCMKSAIKLTLEEIQSGSQDTFLQTTAAHSVGWNLSLPHGRLTFWNNTPIITNPEGKKKGSYPGYHHSLDACRELLSTLVTFRQRFDYAGSLCLVRGRPCKRRGANERGDCQLDGMFASPREVLAAYLVTKGIIYIPEPIIES